MANIINGDPSFSQTDEACAFQGQLLAITGSRRKRPWHYRWPEAVRDEVLAWLLALNAERYAEEQAQTGHGGGNSQGGGGMKRPRGRPPKSPPPDEGQMGLAFG